MVVREVSQRRLALAAGYKSHSYMGRVLRGEVDTLAPEAAVRIARFLQVGVDDLFAPGVSTNTPHSVHRRTTTPVRQTARPAQMGWSRPQGREGHEASLRGTPDSAIQER